MLNVPARWLLVLLFVSICEFSLCLVEFINGLYKLDIRVNKSVNLFAPMIEICCLCAYLFKDFSYYIFLIEIIVNA